MVTGNKNGFAIHPERQRRDRHSARISSRRIRMIRGRQDCRQQYLGIATIKLGTGLDPLLEFCHHLRRQRVIILRHPLIGIVRAQPVKQLAHVRLAGRDHRLARVALHPHLGECVHAVTTLGLFRPVTHQTFLNQHRHQIPTKTHLRRRARRPHQKKQQQTGETHHQCWKRNSVLFRIAQAMSSIAAVRSLAAARWARASCCSRAVGGRHRAAR